MLGTQTAKHPRLCQPSISTLVFCTQVFQELWGTNELLSSFDSINVLPPSAATGIAPDTASWLHTDQAPLRKGLFCIQGIMNMVDVGPDTTGAALLRNCK